MIATFFRSVFFCQLKCLFVLDMFPLSDIVLLFFFSCLTVSIISLSSYTENSDIDLEDGKNKKLRCFSDTSRCTSTNCSLPHLLVNCRGILFETKTELCFLQPLCCAPVSSAAKCVCIEACNRSLLVTSTHKCPTG